LISNNFVRSKFIGISAIDCCDEYYWTGNYECFISRPNTNHNYYVYICKGRKGKSKWSAGIYQSLSYSNSRNIEIENVESKTLKEISEKITNCINNYDKEDRPKKMVDWLEKNRKPVFTIKNKEISIIGYAYSSATSDMQRQSNDSEKIKWLYYNDNIPDYSKNRRFMVLNKDFKNNFYIENVNNLGCGYSAGGIK
jgi:membrane carboxypeptidase/penicillin-binding protein PbpC